MPTTFSFTGGVATGTALGASNTGSVTYTESGVTFTLSASSVVGNATIGMGNGASFPFSFSDAGFPPLAGNDVFTLTLAKTGTPGSNQFSGTGTGANMVQIQLAANNNQGSWKVSFLGGGTGTVTFSGAISDGQLIAAAGQFTGIRFTSSSSSREQMNIESISMNTINCFCAGTFIDTKAGTVAVETLVPGDRILTATGGETTVKWLGQQSIATRFATPEKVNPIRIAAGALGDNTPTRDLYLTADHAIALDGVLYNAGALVNGTTIAQVADMPLDGFTYYHVETDAHELILAEGVASESYLDADWQAGFDNAADRDATTPIPEMDLPRITTARLVPEAVKTRIAGPTTAKRAA